MKPIKQIIKAAEDLTADIKKLEPGYFKKYVDNLMLECEARFPGAFTMCIDLLEPDPPYHELAEVIADLKSRGLKIEVDGSMLRVERATLDSPFIADTKAFEATYKLLPTRRDFLKDHLKDFKPKLTDQEWDHLVDKALVFADEVYLQALRKNSTGG